jgi:hypothetical protein
MKAIKVILFVTALFNLVTGWIALFTPYAGLGFAALMTSIGLFTAIPMLNDITHKRG